MNVALYPRVSTTEQAKEGYSIREQIDRLTKYCDAMGWHIYKIYSDPGYSGANTQRPGLQEMIKDIKLKRVSKVVVYKLDRLSRSQLDTLYLIEKVFLANGVDFVSMSENFDTATPFGRAMIGILAVFAQLEREQIKERMCIGKEGRAKEGLYHGSKWLPIGYDYVNGQLVVNDYEKLQVCEVYHLFVQGMPLRAIETLFIKKGYRHKYGNWNPKTMKRVMKNKTNLGYINHHDTFYKGQHQPIIDEDTFEQAVKLLKIRSDAFKQTGIKPGIQTSLLGGLIYCKHCGGRYTKQSGRKWKGNPAPLYYTCYSRSKKVKAMIKDPNCKNKNYKMEELNNLVFDRIKELALDRSVISELKKENQSDTDNTAKIQLLRNEIKKIDAQISKLMDLYSLDNVSIDIISQKLQSLGQSRNNLEIELSSLSKYESELSEEEAYELACSFKEVLKKADFNETRMVIESLINRIEIDNDKVSIYWKFV